MFISLNYISLFIADMILSIVNLWDLNDLNEDDEQLLKFLKNQL